MAKFSLLLLLNLLLSGLSPHGSQAPHNVVIHHLTANDGSSIGTLYGAKLVDHLYSEFIVVNKTDTLYRIDSSGFHNSRGLQAAASTQGYDGWRIKLTGTSSFEVWLTKRNGPTSDPADVIWVDSLKTFSLYLAGEPVE